MILNCPPAAQLKGRIRLPASKSYTIRAFIIAARGGASRILHASDCDDAVVALKTARALGATVQGKGSNFVINTTFPPPCGEGQGGGSSSSRSQTFLIGESGTTLRFLLPLLGLHTKKAKVLGKGTLVGRPNTHLCETLRRHGMDIRGEGGKESVPIVFGGGTLSGGLMSVDGSLSSQFISALLIALPSLPEDSRLTLTGKRLISQDYIQMTIEVLARTGITISPVSQREYFIKGGQTFKGLKKFDVPSDYGLAAFAMAACAILPSNVVFEGNWDKQLIQSDEQIMWLLRTMGVHYEKTSRVIKIKGPFDLKGGNFSLKDCPDLVPIMSVLALFAQGKTTLTGIGHARAKESDRISDLRKELLKVGAAVTETTDALTIESRASYKTGQTLDSHHDHRLAMAFTVLGLKIGCRVQGIESCRKSYPSFVRDMRALGMFKRF